MAIALTVTVALAAALALFFIVRALRPGVGAAPSATEAVLLEEAVITEPVAPGMEGKAEIRRRGADPLILRVQASDSSQAYARGAKVRVIDLRDGLCIIEGAEQEHLVR
jgi:hypothetical protein